MARSHLTAESATSIIESAFTPLRCVAERWDYGERVRFRVFDSSDEPAFTVEELLKRQFADSSNLKSLIDSWRATLVKRGFVLESWEFPTIPTIPS
ncbi:MULTISPECIES: hypothetical protein [unclassified Pseudomonas]|uniref:hypothetical protein n=1 Tax=unclassified Pseudomonas TaxID=196821 RepID=UPI0011AEDDD8|nr:MULTISPECIES: hypothetical protein [unclassified Pseudomonas]